MYNEDEVKIESGLKFILKRINVSYRNSKNSNRNYKMV